MCVYISVCVCVHLTVSFTGVWAQVLGTSSLACARWTLNWGPGKSGYFCWARCLLRPLGVMPCSQWSLALVLSVLSNSKLRRRLGIAKPYLKRTWKEQTVRFPVPHPPQKKSHNPFLGFPNVAEAPRSQSQHCGSPSFTQLGHGAKWGAFSEVQGLEIHGFPASVQFSSMCFIPCWSVLHLE